VDFVKATTDSASPKFVPPEERIATFDQDGTLWVEHPIYSFVMYALDRVPAVVKAKPQLAKVEPFKTVLTGDRAAIAKLSLRDLEKIIAATFTGMSVDQFSAEAKKWIETAQDARWKRPYTELTYQPMQDVLQYLRDNSYKTYIVTGGGQDFVRVYSERVYGIPPEQVVGTSGGLQFTMKDGRPALMKLPNVVLNDDKEGKPVGIQRHIGRRPIAAFGNSDGDLQMLQWTCHSTGLRLCLYVHHTDGRREWAYDRESHIGKLDKGLDEAKLRGWTVVDMKDDWNRVFPFE
jgi:phosphoglycolate phosphatase-like HAD superfamily hydrolase